MMQIQQQIIRLLDAYILIKTASKNGSKVDGVLIPTTKHLDKLASISD